MDDTDLTIEGDPEALLNKWPFLIRKSSISTFAVAWLFKEGGKWVFKPRVCGSVSLFYNAVFFLRINWPIGIFVGLRWSASTDGAALFQRGIGYKLNGRLCFITRIQSDESAAKGVSGPNLGQATGFDFGTH